MTYLNPEGEEHYRIDTLSQDRLRISGELQGIPTTIHFMRVRMPGELPPKD